jgi:galactokinase
MGFKGRNKMSPNTGNQRQITDNDPPESTRSPSFKDEPQLAERISLLRQQFRSMYKVEEEAIVRSPGRAEIIGNHTDYNNGLALASAISRSTIALLRKREDKLIRVFSYGFAQEPVVFSTEGIVKDKVYPWVNYVKGVIKELLGAGHLISGADVLIDSNIPASGGVSSSAALELAIAFGFSSLYEKEELDRFLAALLCQRAENNFVGSPCGLLDQVAVALGVREQMVLIDFQPQNSSPVATRLVPATLARHDVSFVIIADSAVKRRLAETGYPARRKMCEESLPILTRMLARPVSSLRDISVEEFKEHRRELDSIDRVMRMRVEHVVKENKRVLDAVIALEKNNIAAFGNLLTASGRSALELYELDEGTPELTHLVNTGRNIAGVLGMRNMGGGFSAIALALVQNKDLFFFQEQLNNTYQKQFGKNLDFIEFKVTQGVEVLENVQKRESSYDR